MWEWIKKLFTKKPVLPKPSVPSTPSTGSQNNSFKLFYPGAHLLPEKSVMKSRGKYKNGKPEGVIVHYTSGWQNQKASGMIEYANSQGYLFYFIDEAGKVWQQFDLVNWGNHAGTSKCPVTGRTSVSNIYVGIEIACAGKYDSATNKSWFGKKILNGRHFIAKKPGPQTTGWYEPYTDAQEKALIDLLKWMVDIGVNPKLIFGHDEVSPGRKQDPGGSLSMGMDNLRKIISDYAITKI